MILWGSSDSGAIENLKFLEEKLYNFKFIKITKLAQLKKIKSKKTKVKKKTTVKKKTKVKKRKSKKIIKQNKNTTSELVIKTKPEWIKNSLADKSKY